MRATWFGAKSGRSLMTTSPLSSERVSVSSAILMFLQAWELDDGCPSGSIASVQSQNHCILTLPA
jgi:hypothetical protein